MVYYMLILKVPIATKGIFWNVLEASSTNSVDPDQTAPIGAVWSGSTLFASLLALVNNVRKSMQQKTDRQQFSALRFNSMVLGNVSCFWCLCWLFQEHYHWIRIRNDVHQQNHQQERSYEGSKIIIYKLHMCTISLFFCLFAFCRISSGFTLFDKIPVVHILRGPREIVPFRSLHASKAVSWDSALLSGACLISTST